MKTSLAIMITTTMIMVGLTGSSGGPTSLAAESNPGVKYQELINKKNGASVPPVETDIHSEESINVSATPARFIYVQFPGEDSRVITLRDLDTAINERAVQVQEPVPEPEPTK